MQSLHMAPCQAHVLSMALLRSTANCTCTEGCLKLVNIFTYFDLITILKWPSGSILFLQWAGTLSDLFVFDLANMTWTDLDRSVTGSRPSPRYGHGFAHAAGKLYVQGGASSPGTFKLFNIQTTLSLVIEVLWPPIFSGPQAAYFNDLLVFDPASEIWVDLTSSSLGNAPSSRYDHGFTEAGGKLYVQGGLTSGGCHYLTSYMCQPLLII